MKESITLTTESFFAHKTNANKKQLHNKYKRQATFMHDGFQTR